jgi:hypothetical protein
MKIEEINQEIARIQHDIQNSNSILNDIRDKLIVSVGALFQNQIQCCIEVRVKDEYPNIIIEMAPKKQQELMLKMKELQQNAKNIIKGLFEKQRFLKNSETPNYYYSYMIEQELESEILETATAHIGMLLHEFGYIQDHDPSWRFNDKADGYTKHISIDDKIKSLIMEYAQVNTKVSGYISKLNSYCNEKAKLQAMDLWDSLIKL